MQYIHACIKVNGHVEGMLIVGHFHTDPPKADEEQIHIQQLAQEHNLDVQALAGVAQELPVFDHHKRIQLDVWLENVARHLT
jgi:hypothetical protein